MPVVGFACQVRGHKEVMKPPVYLLMRGRSSWRVIPLLVSSSTTRTPSVTVLCATIKLVFPADADSVMTLFASSKWSKRRYTPALSDVVSSLVSWWTVRVNHSPCIAASLMGWSRSPASVMVFRAILLIVLRLMFLSNRAAFDSVRQNAS